MRKTRLGALIGALFPGVQGQSPSITPVLGALPDVAGIQAAILGINPWQATIYNNATNTASFTATQAQIMGAETTYLDLTGTAGAGVALTLPTVAVLLATLTPQQAVVGSSVVLRVLNKTSQTVTMTTATGWTITGTATIATAVWRDFVITLTNVGATPTATMQNVGAGTAN